MVKGTQGKLAIHTENGNIEARGIRGTLNVESGNGDLQVEGTVTTLSLHARTGNVSAQINPGSKMTSSWVVQTGNGNVDLLLPADFFADLDVNAGDGNVRLEFPMARIGGGRQSRIRGPINGGGQHLELHSDKWEHYGKEDCRFRLRAPLSIQTEMTGL